MKKLIFISIFSVMLFAETSIDNTGNSDLISKKNEYKEKIDSEKKQILLQREAAAIKPTISKDSKKVIPRDINKGQSMIIYSAKKNALNRADKLKISTPAFTTCVNNSFTEETINNCFKVK